jgi:hypothetical protein
MSDVRDREPTLVCPCLQKRRLSAFEPLSLWAPPLAKYAVTPLKEHDTNMHALARQRACLHSHKEAQRRTMPQSPLSPQQRRSRHHTLVVHAYVQACRHSNTSRGQEEKVHADNVRSRSRVALTACSRSLVAGCAQGVKSMRVSTQKLALTAAFAC